MERELSITEITAAMGRGFILEPEFDRETLNQSACAGIDCRTCGLCNDLEG